MKSIFKFTMSTLIIATLFFSSCTEEDTLGGSSTSSTGAKIKLKVDFSKLAYECVTVDFKESSIIIVAVDPDGKETYRKTHAIGSYSSGSEIVTTLTGLNKVGTWKFHIYDEAGTWEYDKTQTQPISSSDIEKGRTERESWFVSKKEAGC